MKALDSIRKEWRKPLPPPRLPQPPTKKGKKKTRHGHQEEKQLALPLEEDTGKSNGSKDNAGSTRRSQKQRGTVTRTSKKRRVRLVKRSL